MICSRNSVRIVCAVFVLLSAVRIAGAGAGDEWSQFRGPNSSGVAGPASVPVEFGPGHNALWQVAAGPGHSPCLFKSSIFLTTFDRANNTVSVVSRNVETGALNWQTDFSVRRFEKGHPSFNPASSSPACDGDLVVAYFGSYGLVCLEHDGRVRWEKKLPLTKSFGGNATSPIIAGDRVILYRGNYVDHYLVAYDASSGDELWRVPQSETFTGEMACTACPIVVDEKLIVHSARSVQAFHVSSGELIWSVKCATTATSTPVLVGNEVIVAAWNKMGEPALRPKFPDFAALLQDRDQNSDGFISRKEFPVLWIFHRPEGAEAPMNGGTVRFDRADRNQDGQLDAAEWSRQVASLEKYRAGYNQHGLLAIPLDASGPLSKDSVRTLATQSIPEVPSPVSDGTYVYLVKNGGVLTCLDVKTGRRVYRIRTRGRGTHYASPFIADGKLFTISGAGKISVLSLGPDPQTLATNDMQEDVYASPAVANGVIFVRTHSKLYAFGEVK